MGRFRTNSLFLESNHDADIALYTYVDHDKVYKGKTFPSLRRLYVEMGDVTEYKFACTYLAGWEHWQRMCNNAEIRKEIDIWRDELERKVVSEAMEQIKALAKDGNYNAAKFIATKEWSGSKRGRPSKAEKEAALNGEKRDTNETKAESARILELVKRKVNE
jgi:hypothetical protein